MHWDTLLDNLNHTDRARLARSLVEARTYGGLPAQAPSDADVEWVIGCIDRALDALAAARILISAQSEPRPWADPAYRAFRSQHPDSAVRVRPAELDALQDAARRRSAAAAAG